MKSFEERFNEPQKLSHQVAMWFTPLQTEKALQYQTQNWLRGIHLTHTWDGFLERVCNQHPGKKNIDFVRASVWDQRAESGRWFLMGRVPRGGAMEWIPESGKVDFDMPKSKLWYTRNGVAEVAAAEAIGSNHVSEDAKSGGEEERSYTTRKWDKKGEDGFQGSSLSPAASTKITSFHRNGRDSKLLGMVPRRSCCGRAWVSNSNF